MCSLLTAPPCSHLVEDMLSADDVSCSSSQISAKSEKNMADFDGEESGCEEELVQINSHAELSSHLQQHLPNLASIYHEHLVQGVSPRQPRHPLSIQSSVVLFRVLWSSAKVPFDSIIYKLFINHFTRGCAFSEDMITFFSVLNVHMGSACVCVCWCG